MEKFKVTKEHGRVKKQIGPRLRILVAVPGDEIPLSLAKECGLIKEEPKPEKKAPEKAPEVPVAVKPVAAPAKKVVAKKAAPKKTDD